MVTKKIWHTDVPMTGSVGPVVAMAGATLIAKFHAYCVSKKPAGVVGAEAIVKIGATNSVLDTTDGTVYKNVASATVATGAQLKANARPASAAPILDFSGAGGTGVKGWTGGGATTCTGFTSASSGVTGSVGNADDSVGTTLMVAGPRTCDLTAVVFCFEL